MYSDYYRVRAFSWLPSLFAATVMVGCSMAGSTGSVSGTLTLSGQPPNLQGLRVNFLSESGGKPVSVEVNMDGTFTARNVPAGKVLVGLTYASPEETKAWAESMAAWKASKDKAAGTANAGKSGILGNQTVLNGQAASRNPIAEKYRDPRTSWMSLIVEAGKQSTLSWDIPP